MNRKVITVIIAVLFCTTARPQALPLRDIPDQPQCVHMDRAGLRFPASREAQDHFYDLLDSLMYSGGRNVRIWHVGGSHVQAGHFSYRLQENFTRMADSLQGERGFIFPYRIAKTNSDKSFRTSFTGEWKSAMAASTHKDLNPRFGVMGIAAQTSDSLSTVGIGLNISQDTLWRFDRFRILGYSSSPDAFPYLVCGADTLQFSPDTLTQSWLFDLPYETDTVTIGFHIPEGESFTLTGTQPLSGRRGIDYYCSGVNGARLTTWLDNCPDLARDMQLVRPDLAILAVGINDSACKAVDFKPEVFKENYRRLISLVREQSPDCAFLFITNNDSYRYISRGMTYNWNGPAVQKAMFELAEEYGAAVWDVYDIMGGKDSVIKWRNAGLVKADRLHFTTEGYVLLGDMLYNAIAGDYNSRRQ